MSVVLPCARLDTVHAGPLQSEGEPGRLGVLFLPRKGIAGHPQLASIVDDRASVVRDAAQFSCIYRLSDELYEEPVVQAPRDGRPFAVPRRAGGPVPLADCATGLHRAHDLS